ncbi:MAG: long-chain fatty acid--CoA ligase [Gammaproteobacteria bacterium]|nr:MAG: long-chain fatty acid--CoA ligase [Gammaproteobacteria bacterium]
MSTRKIVTRDNAGFGCNEYRYRSIMLYRILRDAAIRYPNHTVVQYNCDRYSYAELLRMTDSLAESLSLLGLSEGDRLGIFLYNRPEMLVCYFACFKLGVTAVPLNYRLKSDEIRYVVNHAAPKYLITESTLYPEVGEVRPELGSVERYFLVDCDAEACTETYPLSELTAQTATDESSAKEYYDTEAVILYTSGTTGKAKGAILTHEKLVSHTEAHCELVGYEPGDITLVCLSLANNFAFSHQMLAAVHAGSMLEILPFFDSDQVLDRVRKGSITMLYMMPVMYHAVVKLAESKTSLLPNHLRMAVVAGDTTPYIVFEQFKKYFGIEICEGIGMTETQIYALNPLGEGKKPGSVGMPVAYQNVVVQDDNGNVLSHGEIGEICVKSGIVTNGYLNNVQATTESFRDGWFLTGDLGCFDDDGYLWFRGRRKQLIVHDGSNISPQEVEEVFYHHPAVSEAGVIGIPDDLEGENVQAYIVLKPGSEYVTEEMLLEFAASRRLQVA